MGYHSRKSITEVTNMSQLNKVVDAAIRKEMLRILKEELGLDTSNSSLTFPKNAFIDEDGKTKVYLPNRNGGEPVPVKKVRLRENFSSPRCLKKQNQFVKTENNHHMLVYKTKKGKFNESIVTFWDVVERLNRGEAIFQLPEDGEKIIFKLMANDYFIIGLKKQEIISNLSNPSLLSKYLFRVTSLSSRDYRFRLVAASTDKNKHENRRIRTPNFFDPTKENIHAVEVDLNGNIRLKEDD